MHEWTFTSELWIWEVGTKGTWVFLTVPADPGEEIRFVSGPPGGFGSVPVEVRIGGTTWRTSIFPDSSRGYVLPVKKSVRQAEHLEVGDTPEVTLRLRG